VNTLCRDCGALETAAHRSERCTACGSPRLVCHTELGSLAVAHVDCDAFYAAVEKRDRPGLADRPVIIGGGARGVVLACCYVAPLWRALGDADVQGIGGLPGCGRNPAGYGEVQCCRT
jgi:DNA polymerase IV